MPAKNLSHLAQLIANDGHAASFQSLGQYRAALLKEIAQASSAPHSVSGEQRIAAHRLLNSLGEVVTDWHDGPPPERITDVRGVEQTDIVVEIAYGAPPAAQDVAGLVEALEKIVRHYPNPDIPHVDYRVHACRQAEHALAAHRAKQGEQQS